MTFIDIQAKVGAERVDRVLKSLDEHFTQMLVECKTALSTYERQATTLRWWSFGIAMIGALAGSVGVPVFTAAGAAANATTIAALGGISGAANTAQNTLTRLGLTPEEAIKVRESIRAKWDAALLDYYKANTIQEKETALEKARVACVNYAISNPEVKLDTTPVTAP